MKQEMYYENAYYSYNELQLRPIANFSSAIGLTSFMTTIVSMA